MSENNDMNVRVTLKHGRGLKYRFEAVVKRVVVPALAISIVATSAAPAFAATPAQYASIGQEVSSQIEFNIASSVSEALNNIMGSVNYLKSLKASGQITDSALKTLNSQLQDLQQKLNFDKNYDESQVESVLSEVDAIVKNMSTQSAKDVKSTVDVIRAMLGTVTMTPKMAKASSTSSEVKSFDDVKSGDWFYNYVMKATLEYHLFEGTKQPVNGVGHFNPNGTMTRAQFLTVIMRAIEPDEQFTADAGQKWYENYYEAAVDYGIITSNAMPMTENFDKEGIPRQEMAYALINAVHYLGYSVDVSKQVSPSQIPDWSSIGTFYQSYVREAYTLGLIAGYSDGSFKAARTLTRAEGCTVLMRLKTPQDLNTAGVSGNTQTPATQTNVASYYSSDRAQFVSATAQTWKEGETHSIPKVGDTVIRKSDGKAIVITATEVKNGSDTWTVLGLGQGVDIWTGLKMNNYVVKGSGSNPSVMQTSKGFVDTTVLQYNPASGELHTSTEWSLIYEKLPQYAMPSEEGTHSQGDVANTFWTWDTSNPDIPGEWVLIRK